VNDTKPTLLIVEDDLDIAEMLNAYFRVQGYEVLTVNWGEDGIRSCLTAVPDLVILDIRLPDVDGFEVAKRLRSNRKTRHIPIIFLTEKRERSDRLKGLELKADDYVTKPFDIQELRLRVRNALHRSRQGTLTNPVTGLPEGSLVDEALEEAIGSADGVAMVVTIKNINRFREVYGFVSSDDMLRAVSLMIRDIIRDLGSPDDLVGHLTHSDFLVLTHQQQLPGLRDRLRKRLEQSFDYFYSDVDREQGTFRDQLLGVQINDIVLSTLNQQDLSYLKAELQQFCHQANLK
jgi:DNA-binding response OmpR family regulator